MNFSAMLHFLNFYCVPPVKLIVRASQAINIMYQVLYIKHRDIAVNKARIPSLKEPLRSMGNLHSAL